MFWTKNCAKCPLADLGNSAVVSVLDLVTSGGFKIKLTVWPLKGSETLVKQHCSITVATVQQGKSGNATNSGLCQES